MAKLKGPLFSLGASQQLGKALVYFNWKGLDCVREYVIPSNPKTDAQNTQRGYLRTAVGFIHAAMARPTLSLGSTDITAYALWASIVQSATTWFNQAVRNILDQAVAVKGVAVYRGGSVGPGALQLQINLYSEWIAAAKITEGKFYYGTSKTSLIHSKDATIVTATNRAWADITGLAAKTKYFIQFRPTVHADWANAWSGIYYGTTT